MVGSSVDNEEGGIVVRERIAKVDEDGAPASQSCDNVEEEEVDPHVPT